MLRRRGRYLAGRGGFIDDLKSGFGKVGSFFRGVGRPLVGAATKVADTVMPGSGSVLGGIAKLIGMGKYTGNNTILASPVPYMHSSLDRGVRVTHHEYLGELTTSTDLVVTSFDVNPGLAEVFPWLSTIARGFQSYTINGLVFYLRSTSGMAVASSSGGLALGTVMGAYQYNLYAEPPASKMEMLEIAGATDSPPSQDQIYAMECAPQQQVFKTHLVRSGEVKDDRAKYDSAKFILATSGSLGEYTAGELWVAYDVTLKSPAFIEPLISNLSTSGNASSQKFYPLGTSVNPTSWEVDDSGVLIKVDDYATKTQIFVPPNDSSEWLMVIKASVASGTCAISYEYGSTSNFSTFMGSSAGALTTTATAFASFRTSAASDNDPLNKDCWFIPYVATSADVLVTVKIQIVKLSELGAASSAVARYCSFAQRNVPTLKVDEPDEKSGVVKRLTIKRR